MRVDWKAAAWPTAALQSRASREDITVRGQEKRKEADRSAVRAHEGNFFAACAAQGKVVLTLGAAALTRMASREPGT